MDDKLILYFDDNKARLKTATAHYAKVGVKVVTNKTTGAITSDQTSGFIEEVITIVREHSQNCLCVLLDLDFNGDPGQTETYAFQVGFKIGQAIRDEFLELPIFIVSNHDFESIQIGHNLFDYDLILKPNFIKNTPLPSLKHYCDFHRGKRQQIISRRIQNLPNELLKNSKYFRQMETGFDSLHNIFLARPYEGDYLCQNLLLALESLFNKDTEMCSKFHLHDVQSSSFENNLSDKMVSMIYQSDTIIADLSDYNGNVCLELGLAMALNKNIVIIAAENSPAKSKKLFDIKDHSFNFYDPKDLSSLVNSLKIHFSK